MATMTNTTPRPEVREFGPYKAATADDFFQGNPVIWAGDKCLVFDRAQHQLAVMRVAFGDDLDFDCEELAVIEPHELDEYGDLAPAWNADAIVSTHDVILGEFEFPAEAVAWICERKGW